MLGIHTLTFPWERNPKSSMSLYALSCASLEEGWWSKVKLFLSPSSIFPNSYFCSSGVLQLFFCKPKLLQGFSFCRWLSKTGFSRLAERYRSWFTTAGAIVRTKVFMPIIWCTSGQNSSRIPWYMLLDPIVPTKPLLSVDGCQIIFVGGENKNWEHFISP